MQGQIRWAMAGRSREKLEKEKASLAKRFPAAKDTAILIGNADDLDSLQKIASQAKVLISTSGPFAKLGNKVVEACVLSGTHYCDCTGWLQTRLSAVMSDFLAHHLCVLSGAADISRPFPSLNSKVLLQLIQSAFTNNTALSWLLLKHANRNGFLQVKFLGLCEWQLPIIQRQHAGA